MEPVPEKGAKTTKVEIVEIGGAGAQNENLGIRDLTLEYGDLKEALV